jgi:hypothetical protein
MSEMWRAVTKHAAEQFCIRSSEKISLNEARARLYQIVKPHLGKGFSLIEANGMHLVVKEDRVITNLDRDMRPKGRDRRAQRRAEQIQSRVETAAECSSAQTNAKLKE